MGNFEQLRVCVNKYKIVKDIKEERIKCRYKKCNNFGVSFIKGKSYCRLHFEIVKKFEKDFGIKFNEGK